MDDDGLIARVAAGDDTALCASAVFAAGIVAVTVFGARDSSRR
jgi:hypothetical protein